MSPKNLLSSRALLNEMINFPCRLQMNSSIQIKKQEILTVGTSFSCCAGNAFSWTFINQATCLNKLLLFQFYHDCDLFLRFRGLERSSLLRKDLKEALLSASFAMNCHKSIFTAFSRENEKWFDSCCHACGISRGDRLNPLPLLSVPFSLH